MKKAGSFLMLLLLTIVFSHSIILAYPVPQKELNATIIYVPHDTDLQTAINQIEDGGIIEIAEGTYTSPSGGFVLNNLGKSFTIRAADSDTVLLDGANTHEIITFINSQPEQGGTVTFQNLIFANGHTTTDGRAGGVTLQKASAQFQQCTFRNNQGQQPNTGGGGVLIASNSIATFKTCIWSDNTDKHFGGGMAIEDQSKVLITDSSFTNNKTNVSDHSQTSAGGAIHVGNSQLYVLDTQFEGNQAGYVGGAVYAIGNWGQQATIFIANSAFTNNIVLPAYTLPWPTEGGAFHAEDQTVAMIDDSRFVKNQSMTGAAVNLYRANVRISNSVFQGNKATGTGAANGFGGAISAISNDTSVDGNINRRPAQLSIQNTVITNTITGASQSGGGIYIAGDSNRTYGQNGVSQSGTPADNRAKVTLERVIIFNTYVQEASGVPGTGVGAGILADLADLTIQDSMLIANQALGSDNSSGGGLAALNNSLVHLNRATVAHNRSGKFGGGMFIQGSTVQVENSYLFGNMVDNNTYGTAIFSSPDTSRNIDVSGYLSGCTMLNNSGRLIFDDDRDITNVAINDVRYNANNLYASYDIYQNSLAGTYDVTGLNNLIVYRAQNGRDTKKSSSPNIQMENAPFGRLLVIPPYTNPYSNYPSEHYLGFSWYGDSATLNHNPITATAGVIKVSNSGTYTLTVSGNNKTITVTADIKILSHTVYLPCITKS